VVVADLSGTRASAVAGVIAQEGGNAQWLKDGRVRSGRRAGGYPAGHGQLGPARRDVQHAGMGTVETLEAMALETWNRTLAVTLTSAFLGIKYSCRSCANRAADQSSILPQSRARPATYGMSAYNAAKAGVINLGRGAALENAKYTESASIAYVRARSIPAYRKCGRQRRRGFKRQARAKIPSAGLASPRRSPTPYVPGLRRSVVHYRSDDRGSTGA